MYIFNVVSGTTLEREITSLLLTHRWPCVWDFLEGPEERNNIILMTLKLASCLGPPGGSGERNNFILMTLKFASCLGLLGGSGERNNFILMTLKLASCLGPLGGLEKEITSF